MDFLSFFCVVSVPVGFRRFFCVSEIQSRVIANSGRKSLLDVIYFWLVFTRQYRLRFSPIIFSHGHYTGAFLVLKDSSWIFAFVYFLFDNVLKSGNTVFIMMRRNVNGTSHPISSGNNFPRQMRLL